MNQIITSALNATDLKRGTIKDIPDISYKNGFSFSGRVGQLLDLITKKCSLTWSVQDGAIQIYAEAGSLNQTAVLLSATSGMLGTPNKTEEGMEVTSLLNPEIRVGRKIKVVSKYLNGYNIFTVTKIVHQGDNYEGEFTTKIEGKK
jgi:hypothetical protein